MTTAAPTLSTDAVRVLLDESVHYTVGSSGSWFTRCDAPLSEAAWWVTLTGAAVTQADSARRAGQLVESAPTFVRWRAVLTRGGEVGPAGSTALLVRELRVVRPRAANDCAAP